MAKRFLLLTVCGAPGALAFAPQLRPPTRGAAARPLRSPPVPRSRLPPLGSAAEDDAPAPAPAGEEAELPPEEAARVGNLVADEEWAGLSMELADAVRTAVVEDLKKNSR